MMLKRNVLFSGELLSIVLLAYVCVTLVCMCFFISALFMHRYLGEQTLPRGMGVYCGYDISCFRSHWRCTRVNAEMSTPIACHTFYFIVRQGKSEKTFTYLFSPILKTGKPSESGSNH